MAAVRVQRFLPATVLAVAAFLAVLPLLVQGCSCGHDFDFHLQSWMEAAWQWQHGVVKPVWAFTPAYNAGEPRLLFYPPLSWVTGAVTGLVMPWTVAPVAFTWLVLVLSGLSMHRLLRRWVSGGIAVLGGCLYLLNPYMLFCAYERTAYAELLSAVWVPLLLAALLRQRVSVWRVAVPVGLLWLTNAPSAVVGTYSVLFLGVLWLLVRRAGGVRSALRYAGAVTAGVLLAFLLDAFYLIPLAVERRFVQLNLAVVPIARPDHNFLFAYDKDVFHTHVLVQASWIAIGLIAAAGVCGAALLWRGQDGLQHFSSMHQRDGTAAPRGIVMVLTLFSGVVLFLLLPWSASFWRHAPEVVFLQFPWRFLTVEAAVATVLLSFLVQRLMARARVRVLITAGLLVAGLAGWFAGGVYFREECDDSETVQAQREAFVRRDGVDPTDEYTPTDADNDELHLHLPFAWMTGETEGDPSAGSTDVMVDDRHPEDEHVVTPATDKGLVVVRVRAFPGWHVLRDGVEIAPERRADGLMAVPVAPGRRHRVDVVYRTTRDQWAGLAVSGVTLACALWVGRRRRFGIMSHP